MYVKVGLILVIAAVFEEIAADAGVLPDKSVCGKQISDTDLTHSSTIIGDFPWLASIYYTSNKTGESVGTKCAGSLINSRYVLTSTVCVTDDVYLVASVRLGDYDVLTDPDCVEQKCNDPVQEYGIEELIPHHLFNLTEKNNDIALIRLDKEVAFTDYIRPICIGSSDFVKPNNTVVTSGWGVDVSGKLVSAMKKVVSSIITNEECLEIYKHQVNLTEDQFCSQKLDSSVDATCSGDAGGPVMFLKDDQWYQIGLVSFGNKCWRNDSTDAQTKVPNYLKWIEENIKA